MTMTMFGAGQMTLTKRGFTLIELLVVVGMIAVIAGAMTTSVASAQERARIQKATSEVKIISQALLSYQDYATAHNLTLAELEKLKNSDADSGSIGFLLGSASGDKVPALLMASLQAGGKMLDPWGTPYKISVKKGKAQINLRVAGKQMSMQYSLPNFYRVADGERVSGTSQGGGTK